MQAAQPRRGYNRPLLAWLLPESTAACVSCSVSCLACTRAHTHTFSHGLPTMHRARTRPRTEGVAENKKAFAKEEGATGRQNRLTDDAGVGSRAARTQHQHKRYGLVRKGGEPSNPNRREGRDRHGPLHLAYVFPLLVFVFSPRLVQYLYKAAAARTGAPSVIQPRTTTCVLAGGEAKPSRQAPRRPRGPRLASGSSGRPRRRPGRAPRGRAGPYSLPQAGCQRCQRRVGHDSRATTRRESKQTRRASTRGNGGAEARPGRGGNDEDERPGGATETSRRVPPATGHGTAGRPSSSAPGCVTALPTHQAPSCGWWGCETGPTPQLAGHVFQLDSD